MQNPYTGLGRYTGSLLTALLLSHNRLDFEIFVLLNKIDGFMHSDYVKVVLDQEGLGRCHVVIVNCPPFSLKQHWSMAKQVNLLKGDIYFYPHFDPPLGIKSRVIFVVHDLLPLKVHDYVQSFKLLKILYFQISIWYSLYRSSKCFAVSETTKADLLGLFGINFCNNIEVAYEGPVLNSSVSQKNNINGFVIPAKFLLYVGDRRPHKNLRFIIDLFVSLRAKNLYNGELILVGSLSNFNINLDAYIKNLSWIKFIGNISDEELSLLYSKTDSLLFLSKYEGFGLPVVEAALYGRKMILSDGGSLPEIAPEWACIIPNDTSFDMALKIASEYLKNEIKINATKYNSRFDWVVTSRKIFPEAYV